MNTQLTEERHGSITGLFTGLNPGTYDVRMRDAMSPVCFRILERSTGAHRSCTAECNSSSTDIVCYGANNGSILISSPSGGSGPMVSRSMADHHGKDPEHSTAFRLPDLQPYDPGCCIPVLLQGYSIRHCVITEPPAAYCIQWTSTGISCFGSTDGSITISSPAGGHGTYEFSALTEVAVGSWQVLSVTLLPEHTMFRYAMLHTRHVTGYSTECC